MSRDQGSTLNWKTSLPEPAGEHVVAMAGHGCRSRRPCSFERVVRGDLIVERAAEPGLGRCRIEDEVMGRSGRV